MTPPAWDLQGHYCPLIMFGTTVTHGFLAQVGDFVDQRGKHDI